MNESFHLARSENLVTACLLEKLALSRRLLGKPELRSMTPEVIGDRARLDLQWKDGVLGVYAAHRTLRAVVDPDTANPAIAEMMRELLADPLPIGTASLRFRAGVGGIRGLWIDAANEDIKRILDEGKWATRQLAKGWTVEVGQKRKHIVRNDSKESGLGLAPAPALPWLPSFDLNNEEIPLLSHVALFSQPGPEVNRALIAAGFELLDEAGLHALPWAEWGAGYGNLSAAYASRLGASKGWASEFDPSAAALLETNAREFCAGLRTSRASADDRSLESEEEGARAKLWIIDPPRSGFASLLMTLKDSATPPEWVLAYHCHHEGLAKDSEALKEAGYSLRAWSSVDAFPATPHHEVVSMWRRPR